ncbi:MAG: ABC transporter permease [Pseudomonadota bacterium]|nr:ABC transporter permease [Pseudomonadota bacterium]
MIRASHVYRLGTKELWSILRDPIMLVLIGYGFSLLIYIAATSMPDTLNKVPIAIVDEDRSPLSTRIVSAFRPPEFQPPFLVDLKEVDAGLDAGYFTFSLDIPPNFQRDVLAGKTPSIQLNVDATRMSQAFSGAGYANQIVMEEINTFVQRYQQTVAEQVELAYRIRFNPNMSQKWFGSIIELMNMVTMLSIILAGAALIREREHGTIEHLLVMPMTPIEIMLAKVWATGLIVLIASTLSVTFVVKGWLGIPIQGSVWFFVLLTGLYLFSTTSMGIFMATIARSMPQFGLLMMLVMMPMLMLSGGVTPRESMPLIARVLMDFMPSTHYVSGTQAILYRGAGIEVISLEILSLLAIGLVFFTVSLLRFRQSVSQAA